MSVNLQPMARAGGLSLMGRPSRSRLLPPRGILLAVVLTAAIVGFLGASGGVGGAVYVGPLAVQVYASQQNSMVEVLWQEQTVLLYWNDHGKVEIGGGETQ